MTPLLPRHGADAGEAAPALSRDGAARRLRLSLGRRGTALALAIAVELAVALMLLFLWPALTAKKDRPQPAVFGIEVGDDREAPRAEEESETKRGAPAEARPRETQTPPPPLPPVPPAVTEPVPPLPPDFIRQTRREYSNSDIADIPDSKSAAPGEAGTGAESGGSRGGDSAVAGRGPKGETLYAAEWYRRPTNAELATYRSKRAIGPGWGLIACRTVEGFRVEDCQELSESPRGSGYAGSVRQAAWQFRVKPPRVNGKLMVGEWVSIRIDYTVAGD